jgi:glutathionyl-hydroquinone reductase
VPEATGDPVYGAKLLKEIYFKVERGRGEEREEGEGEAILDWESMPEGWTFEKRVPEGTGDP